MIHGAAGTDDAVADVWTPAAGLATGRWAFAVATLPNGRVLVTGGVSRSGLAAADPTVTELAVTSEVFALDDAHTPVTGSAS